MLRKILLSIPLGAAAGVAAVTALPICGAIGTITATGAIIATTVGAAATTIDAVVENYRNGS